MDFCVKLLIILSITQGMDLVPMPLKGNCRSNNCEMCVSSNCIWMVTSLDDGDCKSIFAEVDGELLGLVTIHTKDMCMNNDKSECTINTSTYLLIVAGVIITVGFSVFLYYFKKGRLSKRNMDKLVKSLPRIVQPVADAAVEIMKPETTVQPLIIV